MRTWRFRADEPPAGLPGAGQLALEGWTGRVEVFDEGRSWELAASRTGDDVAVIGLDVTEIKREREASAALQRILAACGESQTVESLFETVCDALGLLFDTTNFYVAMYDARTGLYSFPFSRDEDDDDYTPQELRSSLTDYVRRTGMPLYCDWETHIALGEAGEVAVVGAPGPLWLGAPLRTPTLGVFGVAVVQSYMDPNAYTREDLAQFDLICKGISGAVYQLWSLENERAAHQLRERSLIESRDEAMRTAAAKSSFLARMSHELRTPLNAIIGYAELIVEDLSDVGIDGTDVVRIQTAAEHQLRLIDQLLDLTRVESGHEEVTPTTFALGELLYEVRGLLEPVVEKGGNTLVVLADVADASLHTDRTKLLQCLVNLGGNAAKFTENGIVTVRVELSDDEARFEVADTGIGIDPDDLDRMFEPFAQADERTTRRVGGTGLGLAITRVYAEMLGGTCTAASFPGRGSTFRISIPRTVPIARAG